MVEATVGPPPVRVLVADDDRRVRAALVGLLEASTGFTVVAATADPAVAATSVVSLRPDVALVDLLLPDVDSGLALVSLLAGTYQVPVLALSAQDGLRLAALAAGASTFLHKGSPPETVLAAVRSTATGGRPLAKLGDP